MQRKGSRNIPSGFMLQKEELSSVICVLDLWRLNRACGWRDLQKVSLYVLVAADLSPVQVPLIQTPLGQNDSESDTDSSSGFSTPVATSGESTKEQTTTEKRPTNSKLFIISNIIFWCKSVLKPLTKLS